MRTVQNLHSQMTRSDGATLKSWWSFKVRRRFPPALRHVNPHPVPVIKTTFGHTGFASAGGQVGRAERARRPTNERVSPRQGVRDHSMASPRQPLGELSANVLFGTPGATPLRPGATPLRTPTQGSAAAGSSSTLQRCTTFTPEERQQRHAEAMREWRRANAEHSQEQNRRADEQRRDRHNEEMRRRRDVRMHSSRRSRISGRMRTGKGPSGAESSSRRTTPIARLLLERATRASRSPRPRIVSSRTSTLAAARASRRTRDGSPPSGARTASIRMSTKRRKLTRRQISSDLATSLLTLNLRLPF